MRNRKTVVHVLAGGKVDPDEAIGRLVTSRSYLAAVGRTIFLRPFGGEAGVADESLAGGTVELLYRGGGEGEGRYGRVLADVERKFGVRVAYGRVRFVSGASRLGTEAEVLFVDAQGADANPVNVLKAWLYEEFGLESLRFEHEKGYDDAVRLAPAALGALRAVGAADPNHPAVLVAHGVEGLPTALAAVLDPLQSFKTLFWARELPTVGRLIEGHPGHDTMFFNAARWGRERRYYLHEVFEAARFTYRYSLMTAGRYCDAVAAVGRAGSDFMHFLDPNFDAVSIGAGYHGVASVTVEAEQKEQWRETIRSSVAQELGCRPEYVFTHTSPVRFRTGYWRDLRVCEELNALFDQAGRTGVLVFAGPVAQEANSESGVLCQALDAFNERCEHIKVVHVDRLQASEASALSRSEWRLAGDVEFYEAVYDAMAIEPLEALSGGAMCVLSSACGSVGLLDRVADSRQRGRVIVADYADLCRPAATFSLEEIIGIGQPQRDEVEGRIARQTAERLYAELVTSSQDWAVRLGQGREIAAALDADGVCRDCFLPALDRAYSSFRTRQIA